MREIAHRSFASVTRITLAITLLGWLPMDAEAQSDDDLKIEFLTTHDNDALIPYIQADKDYSFGLFEEVRFKGDSSKSLFFKSKVRSVLYSFKAGIMGFTPDHEREDFDPEHIIGRPFAGWLFIEHSQYFVFDKSYARLGIQAGAIGPHAYAGNFQNWFHREFNAGPHVPGWEHQIPGHVGVNLQGAFSHMYLRKGGVMLYGDHKASIGTIFSNLEPAVALRWGRFTSLNNFSRLTDGRLASGKKASWFVDLRGGISYKIYDATLQGNPFTDDAFFTNQSMNNISLIGSFKCSYVTRKLSISVQNHFRSSDLEDSKRYNYGSLVVAVGI